MQARRNVWKPLQMRICVSHLNPLQYEFMTKCMRMHKYGHTVE